MADVWKSQGRKFCEICKVWFGDNRASIEFHERGKKHKEALQAKLRELGKKSREQEKMQAKMSTALAAMEAAALKAMRENGEGVYHGPSLPATGLASKIFDPRQFKDVGTMARELARRKGELQEMKRSAPAPSSSIPYKYHRREPSFKVEYPELSIPEPKRETDAVPPSYPERVWVEADSSDGSGSKYYFHMYTGESKWEQPDSFYTIEEYQQLIKSMEQNLIEAEAHSQEEMNTTSANVEVAPKEEETPIKSEIRHSTDLLVGIEDIPLPGAASSITEARVAVKEEPLAEHSKNDDLRQSEDQSVLSLSAATSGEIAAQSSNGIPEKEEEVEKPSVYGSWTRVKEVKKQPVYSPLTAKFRAEEQRQRREQEERDKLAEKMMEPVEFTEKTSAPLTKKVKGPIEFKKRTATKNVRQRIQ